MKYKDEMIEALVREIELRKNYFIDEPVETIYFGGGTPSILPSADIKKILRKITNTFELTNSVEITLEANPDDLTTNYIKEIYSEGINRLSIGVQSFFDKDLEWMNRAHNSREAYDCIRKSQDIGIENISIDLIYGTPGLSDSEWLENINKALSLAVPHISSYALTVEKGTALGNWVEKKKIKPMDEEQAASQFEILIETLNNNKFEHYEISNFAKPGFYSKHNSSYWEGKKYLGIGPSAHSFNKLSRQWNISNNNTYINELFLDKLPFIEEKLQFKDRYNEYLMVSLRTSKGISKKYISEEFGSSILDTLLNDIKKYIDNFWLIENDTNIHTSNSGKLMADKIASELFILEDFNNEN